jgi:hypothetical protein
VLGNDRCNVARALENGFVDPGVVIGRPEIHYLSRLQFAQQLLIRSIFQIAVEEVQICRMFIYCPFWWPSRNSRKNQTQCSIASSVCLTRCARNQCSCS